MMQESTLNEHHGTAGSLGLRIAVGAVLCLVAAGAILWWQQGDAVFASMITAALAWCF